MSRETDEARRLREEADRCEKRAQEEAEGNPMYADHLQRRADHCRRLARDEEHYSNWE